VIFAREPNRLVCIDYGSAWTMERTVAKLKGHGNTELYAAPEQYEEGRSPDFRADQFSATVVAYEMLTGKPPYGGMAEKPVGRSSAAATNLSTSTSDLCP